VDPPLSPTQFALLELLYRSPGRVISHPELIAAVWPEADPEGVSKDAVNSLIKRLRARLRQVQPARDYIEVLRGHGLRLITPKEEPTH
jgi:two-component system catabolic regulation response regulator CreB